MMDVNWRHEANYRTRMEKPFESMTPEERKERTRLDVVGLTVSGIYACAKSLLALENLRCVTPEDLVKLERLHDELHVTLEPIVTGRRGG